MSLWFIVLKIDSCFALDYVREEQEYIFSVVFSLLFTTLTLVEVWYQLIKHSHKYEQDGQWFYSRNFKPSLIYLITSNFAMLRVGTEYIFLFTTPKTIPVNIIILCIPKIPVMLIIGRSSYK